MHRERSSMWKQHGAYMTDFNQIVLGEDGSAEIHGPAVRFPKPSDRVLVFSVQDLTQSHYHLGAEHPGTLAKA